MTHISIYEEGISQGGHMCVCQSDLEGVVMELMLCAAGLLSLQSSVLPSPLQLQAGLTHVLRSLGPGIAAPNSV